MIRFQAKVLLALASVVTVSTVAKANEESYRFRCQSKELGIVEIVLSKPVQATIGCQYFDVDVTRYDLNHVFVEKRHHDEKDSERNFEARLCRGDSYALVWIPPTHVDWSAHGNQCWVNSPFVGMSVHLDTKTGAAVSPDGSGTWYSLQELNPSATFKWHNDGGPFRMLWPFVNGRRCEDATGNSADASPEPTCGVF